MTTLRNEAKPLIMSGFCELTRLFLLKRPLIMSGSRVRFVISQFGNASGDDFGIQCGKTTHKCAVFAGSFVERKEIAGFGPRICARFWSLVRQDPIPACGR